MVMERLRLTQNTTMGAPAFSVSDLSGPLDSRNLVPSLGMNMYMGAKMQKSLDQIPTNHNLRLMEPRTEKWKMPLSFKCVGTFRFVFVLINVLLVFMIQLWLYMIVCIGFFSM